MTKTIRGNPVIFARIMLLFFLLCGHVAVFGQTKYFSTLPFIRDIPQSNQVNPALFFQPGFFVGVPFLSSAYLSWANDGFMPGDLIKHDMYDERIWDEESFIAALDPVSMVYGNVHLELLSFGFRSESRQYIFSMTEKAWSAFSFTPDLMRVITKGSTDFNGPISSRQFDGLSFDMSHYREIAAGVAQEFSPAFSAGLKAKLLLGMSNIRMDYGQMSLSPDVASGDMHVHTDLILHSSNTSLKRYLKQSERDYRVLDSRGKRRDYLSNTRNPGFAVDLGMVIKPAEAWTLALSVLDLGFINWKQGVENFDIKGSSGFDGISLQDLLENNFPDNFAAFTDTTSLAFNMNETYEKYRSMLTPKMHASLAWDLSRRQKLALQSHAFFYNDRVYPSLGFAYQARPSNALGLAVSYTIMHQDYANIGFGFNLNMGPLQLYVISDNVLAPFRPYQSRVSSIQGGVNLVFGYKTNADKPVYE